MVRDARRSAQSAQGGRRTPLTIEADRGKLKQPIKPVRGFETSKTAYAAIKSFEVMHALRKGQAARFQYGGGIMGEVRLIERQFSVYTA